MIRARRWRLPRRRRHRLLLRLVRQQCRHCRAFSQLRDPHGGTAGGAHGRGVHLVRGRQASARSNRSRQDRTQTHISGVAPKALSLRFPQMNSERGVRAVNIAHHQSKVARAESKQRVQYTGHGQPYAFGGPNGLPLHLTLPPLAGPALGGGVGGAPMFLLPQSAGAGGPYMSGPPQFPGAPMQYYAPPPQQPQHHHHHHHQHGKRQHQHQRQQQCRHILSRPNLLCRIVLVGRCLPVFAATADGEYESRSCAVCGSDSDVSERVECRCSEQHPRRPARLPVPFAMAPFADLLSSVPLPLHSAPYFSVDVHRHGSRTQRPRHRSCGCGEGRSRRGSVES